MDVEEQRGVLLGLSAQWVIAVHDHQLLTEVVNTWRSHNPKHYISIYSIFFKSSWCSFEILNGIMCCESKSLSLSEL